MAVNPNLNDRPRAVLVIIATMGMIAFAALAAAGYVGGVMPGAILAKYPSVLTPAGYGFSLWVLIYLGLAAFSIFQLLPANQERFRPVRSLYIFSCVLNCAWIYFLNLEMIGLCFAVIVLLWVTLLLIKVRLAGCATFAETWMMQAPLGIYFGWITITLLVALMGLLKYLGSAAASSRLVGSSLILIAAVCAVIVRVKLWNFFFPLSIAWGVTAIAVAQSGNTAIVVSAALCVVICLVTTGSFVVNLRDSTSE